MIWLSVMIKYIRGDSVEPWFAERLKSLDIEPTPAMMEKFSLYHTFLAEKNAVMNLTAITGEEEVYRKHFLDSLFLVKAFSPAGKTLLDVGSGAGFPSLPLKIVFPSLRVTVIDALDKRIGFLRELCAKLEMPDVELIHGRAEEYEKKNHFGIVTARAVAPMNMLTELCLPFVKVGGLFLAMKSPGCEAELKIAGNAVRTLGGTREPVISYRLDDRTEHWLVPVRKIRETGPGYPRTFALIKKKPL